MSSLQPAFTRLTTAGSASLLGRARHPLWFDTGVGLTVLMVFCLAAAQIDDRLLNEVNVWTKPFKFSLSLAVYFFTLTWFAPLASPYGDSGAFQRPFGHIVTWSPVVAAVFEMVYICYQAALGEASHFNIGTAFHATMYSLMGAGATVLVLACVGLAWMIGRARGLGDPYVLGVVLGLVLTCLLGGLFGAAISGNGSHWVGGAPSDANGLFLVNWVRDGGDLRVAHFFGMHAMQVLPFAAYGFSRWLRPNPARWSLLALTLVYVSGSSATLVQALNGNPFGYS